MIKIFKPQQKGKNKSNIRGFWLSPQGHLYYDYIGIEVHYSYPSYRLIYNLLKTLNQEAISIIYNNILRIHYQNKTEILPHRIYKEVKPKDLKRAIKEALHIYKGCTVYIENGHYFLEIFTTI